MDLNRTDFLELSEELLDRGHRLRFAVKGGSMRPFLREGDLLEVERTTLEALRIGDLLVFRKAGEALTVHRYLGRRGDADQTVLIAKGDATRGYDEPINFSQVLGKVVCVYRRDRCISFAGLRHRLVNYCLAQLSPYRYYIIRFLRLFRRR